MKFLLPIGGLLIFGLVIFILIPSPTLQNGGNATLASVIGTDIKGTATLTPFQQGQYLIVDVHLQRLAAGSVYALSVRSGSCYGALVAQLQSATTIQDGTGASSTTIAGPVSASWFIVLYNGPSINNAVLACGQVVVSSTIGGGGNNPPGTPNVSLTPTLTPGVPGQFPNTGGGPPNFPIPGR
jgi:hypothetical protein